MSNLDVCFYFKHVDDSQWSKKSICDILAHVLSIEKSVNTHLLDVHECGDGNEAQKADPQLQDFIEGNFLVEQVESIRELATLLTKLETATRQTAPNGLKKEMCDGLGLYLIDKELQAKYGN